MRQISSAKVIKQFEKVIKDAELAQRERKMVNNIAGVFDTVFEGQEYLNVIDGYRAYRVIGNGNYIPQEKLDAMPKANPDEKLLTNISNTYDDLWRCSNALTVPDIKNLRAAIKEARAKVKSTQGNSTETRFAVDVEGTNGKVVADAVNGKTIHDIAYKFGDVFGVDMVAVKTEYLLEALELFPCPQIRAKGSPILPIYIFDESYGGDCFIMPIRINK